MYWVYMYGKMSIPPISILEMTLFVVLDHVQNISLDIPVGWLENAICAHGLCSVLQLSPVQVNAMPRTDNGQE